MSKLENTLKTLQLIVANEKIQSCELAEAVGVTERQIREYLTCLKAAGINIKPIHGPNGGHYLHSITCPLCNKLINKDTSLVIKNEDKSIVK